jgi:hypothetical protein
MQPRSAPLIRFFLRAVALGFLGVFALAPSLLTQPAAGEVGVVAAGSIGQDEAILFHGFDSILTEQAEIGLSDDGVAFEDSVEMFRADLQQRIFGIGRAKSGPKTSSKAAQNTRPNISPPLLV